MRRPAATLNTHIYGIAIATNCVGSMPAAGRELHADRGTVLIYALITTGAALRVAAPWLPFDYLLLIKVAGSIWGGAFLLFLAIYGPKLLGPRPDGRS